MSKDPLPFGLYERVISERLREQLAAAVNGAAEIDGLDPAEAHRLLTEYISAAVESALRSMPRATRLESQIQLVNRIVDIVSEAAPGFDRGDRVGSDLLTSFLPPQTEPPKRPGIPLSQSDLLVNARDEYRIGYELQQEITSADRVDLICSFVKWGGVRLLLPVLTEYLKSGRPMRVITSTYLGSTDQKAIDKLLDLGAEIRVSDDTRRTRLHAKAWLLHRESGYSTAYIGSSNLSATAQTEGLEWNVRISAVDAGRIIKKFEAAFDNYWEDGEFVPYDGSEEQRENFRSAIRQERTSGDEDLPISFFDIRPYPFQAEILDKLEAERVVHDRTKNLVVAATGTGKTVVAALDFKRLLLSQTVGSLLFVAHRKEILKQSRLMFRHVLRDGSFGELFVDGHRPKENEFVFGSVQSMAQLDLEDLDPEAFDMVIVDEFHHAAARTYDQLLNHLKPKILLGLTATPERADGRSILHWFEDHVAAEIRIWDAIERGLLVPFQYFGVHDNTDLSQIGWRQGRYQTSELEALYTGDHLRANIVLQAIQDHIASAAGMRALGFCVSVKHAEFMAKAFQQAGIPSLALSAQSPAEVRDSAIGRLRRREVNVIFSVDLFNEGIDIPEVDTVLFLRPTESATVFLQQLGRGLRMADDKECLTVLDFVGNAKKEYRFDVRYGALLQMGRSRVREQVEQGFPRLPSGCSIQLDRESTEIVLENLRQTVGATKRSLVSELRRLGPELSLRQFLRETGLKLVDIYRGGRFFSDIARAAGAEVPDQGPDETNLGRALSRVLHLDDAEWINAALRYLAGKPWSGYSERGLGMLLVTLLGPDAYMAQQSASERLFQHPAVVAELSQILEILLDEVDHVALPFQTVPDVPLHIHCRYSLDQIMAAFAVEKSGKLYRVREGVYFDETTGCNLLFVTINKSEKDYSPSTMYEDYALSRSRFHWQSQATTRPDKPKGERHWKHRELGITPLLFVRESRKAENGATAPYFFLGPVECVDHRGERPMTVTWELEEAIPGDWLRRLRVA